MANYGANYRLVDGLIDRAGRLSIEEAADIYHARATRLLLDGEANDRALATARRAAARTQRLPEYEQARREAATAWRSALPETQGPWLMVGAAISNAAGALVLADVLDPDAYRLLMGPWQQAIGSLVPVGPGSGNPARRQPESPRLVR